MGQSNSVFEMELVGDTLVVTPQGDASGFRYNEIHNETNTVLTELGRPRVKNLVVDLDYLQVGGSIVISSIIKMARKINTKKGGAAFCNASENMKKVIESMNLTRLWPCFNSQNEAIRSLQAED